ncbi:MAG: MFS transporter [Verrucomicrobiales bacterium VVV1]|nr:MAG: MFS transporter [Verrucomicrobiales bacterium VVV1]
MHSNDPAMDASGSAPNLSGNPRRFVLFTVFYNARAYYPVLAILFTDLGLTIEQFVLLNLVWAAAIFLFEVPSGALADTLGRKRLLVFSALLMVAEMLCLLMAPQNGGSMLFILCLANRILSGTSEASASGADEALAYDSLPEENRADAWDRLLGTAMRWRSGGSVIAVILGALLYDPAFLNRLLPDSFQISEAIAHRLPVILVLMQAIVCVFITLTMVEPPRPHGEPGPAVLIDGIVRNLLTLQSEYFRLISVPEWSFGIIGAITGIASLAVPAVARRMNQRFDTPTNLAIVGGLSVLILSAVAPAWKGYGLIPAMLLIPCMGYLGFTVSRALHAETDSSQRATVLSVKGLIFNLGYGACSLAFSTALSSLRHSHGDMAFQTLLTRQVPIFLIALVIFFPWAMRKWRRNAGLTSEA